MRIITDYTRDAYRDINRNLFNGIVTDEAAELIEAVTDLPKLPGTTYRTFTVDDLNEYVASVKSSKTITFATFSSTSRLLPVANRFKGNVRLTIRGKTGRDIAPMSDSPNEQETLYLPGLTCQIIRLKRIKVGGQLWSVEIDLVEI